MNHFCLFSKAFVVDDPDPYLFGPQPNLRSMRVLNATEEALVLVSLPADELVEQTEGRSGTVQASTDGSAAATLDWTCSRYTAMCHLPAAKKRELIVGAHRRQCYIDLLDKECSARLVICTLEDEPKDRETVDSRHGVLPASHAGATTATPVTS